MKLKFAGLLLVPVAALVVACGSVQSDFPIVPTTPPATTAPATMTAPPTTPFTATPKPSPTPPPPTFAPVPVTTTAAGGPPCHFRFENGLQLPDSACTPGSVQSTSVKAICTAGWSTAHRKYFTKAEREVAFAKYGVVTVNPAGYGEYDHLIPLELGGSNNASNLWPEKGTIPNAKDQIENAIHEAVCAGRVPLRIAQQAMAQDWTTAGTKVIEVGNGLKSTYVPKPPPTHAKPVTTTAGTCSPTTAGGNCYKAGELCPAADHNTSGTSGTGTTITCKYNNGWRWETV